VFDHLKDLLRHLIRRQISVHRNQASFVLVIIRHRPRLRIIGGQTLDNHVLAVVIASHQLGTVNITDFVVTGWLGVDVVDPSTDRAGTPSGKPTYQLIIVDIQTDHNRQTLAITRLIKELMLEKCIEPASLRRSARETIKNEAALAIGP